MNITLLATIFVAVVCAQIVLLVTMFIVTNTKAYCKLVTKVTKKMMTNFTEPEDDEYIKETEP